DFTPVCTTELGRAAKLTPEFAKRNVKMIALSIDSLPFPITDDKNGDFAIQLDMLDPAENDEKGMLVTTPVVVIFGPDNKPKLCILYPATTGRNIDEILRIIISFQLTAEKEVTPAEWKNGDSMMVLPTIPEEEAKKSFPKGVFSPKSSYLARNTSNYTPSHRLAMELVLELPT
ncbi:hypothetical protein FD755_020022, partial [Muntiacus reevesi]